MGAESGPPLSREGVVAVIVVVPLLDLSDALREETTVSRMQRVSRQAGAVRDEIVLQTMAQLLGASVGGKAAVLQHCALAHGNEFADREKQPKCTTR